MKSWKCLFGIHNYVVVYCSNYYEFQYTSIINKNVKIREYHEKCTRCNKQRISYKEY